MDIISDKTNPEYHERLEWMEMQGYPNEYNMDDVNANLKERYFYKWGKGEKSTQSEIYAKHAEGKYGLRATKKDENDYSNLNVSGKHNLEAAMERFDEQFRYYMLSGKS